MVALAQKQGEDGRFRGLVEEVGDQVIEALADGCSLETAAHCAGVADSALREWCARADGIQQRGSKRGDPDGIYAAWALRARQAQGQVLREVTLRVVKGEGIDYGYKGHEREESDEPGEKYRCSIQAQNDRFTLERRDKGWRREDKHEHEISQGSGAPQIILED